MEIAQNIIPISKAFQREYFPHNDIQPYSIWHFAMGGSSCELITMKQSPLLAGH